MFNFLNGLRNRTIFSSVSEYGLNVLNRIRLMMKNFKKSFTSSFCYFICHNLRNNLSSPLGYIRVQLTHTLDMD